MSARDGSASRGPRCHLRRPVRSLRHPDSARGWGSCLPASTPECCFRGEPRRPHALHEDDGPAGGVRRPFQGCWDTSVSGGRVAGCRKSGGRSRTIHFCQEKKRVRKERAQNQLKQQRDKLKQYQKRITQQLERERELARQLLRDGRRDRAKLLLKKKRYREQLLDKTENQITSLETMVQSIEFTQIEMKVIEGLQFGNECLNKMHQVMSIEEVERVLDETQEAVEYQRQIDELLAGSFTQEDEDAILEELNAITQEQIELPEVPSEPLPEKKPEKVPVQARPRQAELVAAS
ncbi:PREDICTED: charged multivesicular body protein 6 isoform X1 [Hipposideros armiger]|uniref:Charged multivesicular body protein 6 isoform X1 n=1 Tax=Hipposideros armiger TaxID=186990 RepID=A0A8B7SVW7_HIPAR|nr:PREDICTED: charged multivesicular body protein 6 isoform X1 [Hipposideros armiger]